MIVMKNVYKKYPNGVVAANGINIEIDRGEFVYVVGPSGAGKSTFIKMMYREETPTSGEIIINGINLATLRNKRVPYLRRQIGVVFQDFKLLPKLNVYENVAFALEVIEESPAEIRKKVNDVLALVGLHKKRGCSRTNYQVENSNVFPSQDQSSMSRKLSLQMNRQEILDPETSWEIMRIFEQINARGTTIVMATHNREIVNTIRHRVIVVEGGLITRDEYGGEYGMKARTFGRHVRESFKSLRRNSWMTFASVSAVTVTLLLVGVFIVIMMNLNQLGR